VRRERKLPDPLVRVNYTDCRRGEVQRGLGVAMPRLVKARALAEREEEAGREQQQLEESERGPGAIFPREFRQDPSLPGQACSSQDFRSNRLPAYRD
jgi:hypothetical protein